MTENTPSTVYLVGAGPGDPDLITIKGMDLIERCDVLVYDSLVSPELVLRCPAAQKHYVGKTSGGHAVLQDEIIELLVRLATAVGPPRVIVRLKGGDPYVFGRGGEEALACAKAGVPVEVVPGVPAGVAVPAYAGVPITHRDFSRGAIFVTGHRAKNCTLDLPWEHLVGSRLTLVFYMSVSTLPMVAEELVRHGMAADTPVLVVQEGTLPGQRQVLGPLGEIASLAAAAKIRPPALVVVGQVSALGEQLVQQKPRLLAGKTVVLVRAEGHHYPEAQRMRDAGARVFDVPGVRCRLGRNKAVQSMLESISSADVVLLTRGMAARFFVEVWQSASPSAIPVVASVNQTIA
ncbi:MAG: uroporphyrinogen-III C-methyltransferase, partial [Proteobacteria bacterium]|nr:uroporphyrinogen-III C-methyltransferase [Pseudomonadota bacterium]